MHTANEQLSMMANLNIIYVLLQDRFLKSSTIKNLLKNIDIYFIPVVNVDGFIQNSDNIDKSNNKDRSDFTEKNLNYGSDPNETCDLEYLLYL